ncbi:homeodomain-interacting protein kinase 4 [Eudromia elegans]
MVTLESGTECYDVVDTLGKGTFGEVAKSWRRSTGEMVAIKILKDDGHRSRVVRNELKLLRAMGALDADAAHIVRFLEAFHDGAKCYLVFELLQQNLFDFQKERDFSPLPVRHIRTVTAQVLTALAKLEELAIIHADLKPENVMLVDHARHPFRVKLIDFGSASILREVRSIQEPYIQSRFYRAPEILLGLPFCHKVDVWSLGCVMAELHLGWPLYPGGSEYDQVRYICETQGPPRAALLQAARKAPRFFRRAPDAWHLKSPAEHLAEGREKPLERRKFMLRSLDQLETVGGGGGGGGSDREALAERADLRAMVELIKRMLAWDPRERAGAAAALRHPFVSLQQLRAAHRPTRYYQLCQQGLRAARHGAGEADDGDDEAVAQLDHLSLAEAALGEEPAPAPIPAHYGGWHRPRRHPRRHKPDAVLGNLIVLGPRSPRGAAAAGTEEQSPPGRPPPAPHAKRALAEWRVPEAGAWPGSEHPAPGRHPRYLQHVAGQR